MVRIPTFFVVQVWFLFLMPVANGQKNKYQRRIDTYLNIETLQDYKYGVIDSNYILSMRIGLPRTESDDMQRKLLNQISLRPFKYLKRLEIKSYHCDSQFVAQLINSIPENNLIEELSICGDYRYDFSKFKFLEEINTSSSNLSNQSLLNLKYVKKWDIVQTKDTLFDVNQIVLDTKIKCEILSINNYLPIDQIFDLQSLKRLYIWDLNRDSLPNYWGNLTQLEDLHISSKKSIYNLKVLSELSHLKELHLFSCETIFDLDVLCNFRKLQTLGISSYNLTEIPKCFNQLSLFSIKISTDCFISIDDNLANKSYINVKYMGDNKDVIKRYNELFAKYGSHLFEVERSYFYNSFCSQ